MAKARKLEADQIDSSAGGASGQPDGKEDGVKEGWPPGQKIPGNEKMAFQKDAKGNMVLAPVSNVQGQGPNP